MIAALFALPFWALALVLIAIVGMFALVEFERPGWATVIVVAVLGVIHLETEINVINFVAENPIQTVLLIIGYFVVGAAWSVGKWWFFVRRLRDKYDEQKGRFLKGLGLDPEGSIPQEHKEGFLRQVAEDAYYKARNVFYGNHSEYNTLVASVAWPNMHIHQSGSTIESVLASSGTDITKEELTAWNKLFGRSNRGSDLVLSSELGDDLKHEFAQLLSGPQFKAAIIPSPRDHKSRILIWMAWWPWSMAWTLLNDPIKRAFRAIYRALQKRFQSISERAFRRVDDDLMSTPAEPAAES